MSEFDRLVKETVESIRANEPRTVIYATHTVAEHPNDRIFYELYEDRSAFDEHERQDHTRRFLKERERFFVASPEVEFLTLESSAGIGGEK